jgi:hypothetical protein
MGLSLADFDTELADLPGWRRAPGGETHLLVAGRVGQIDVVVEAGKGSDTWDRRVEIHGDRGTCSLGFGTLAHRPGLWVRTDRGQQLWRFPDQDTGYSRHLHDLAVQLGIVPGEPTMQTAESAHHMLASLRLMASWYRTRGETAEEREPIPRVAGHTNPILDESQATVRRRLDQINRTHMTLT